MKRLSVKILLSAIAVGAVIMMAVNNPNYAVTEEYYRYMQNYDSDYTGNNRGITYPVWWGDEISRKIMALETTELVGTPEEISETVLEYAPVFERWAPGHGGELIIHGAYDEGYALDTVETLKAQGYIPADYVHPAAAGQTQQPVVDAPTTTEVHPQPEQQPAVLPEPTPQPVQQPVVEEPTIEETVESETVVETTESEETTVESTEESSEGESVESETVDESSEPMETEETTVEEEKGGFPVVPVLSGLVIFIGLSVGGVLLWKKKK